VDLNGNNATTPRVCERNAEENGARSQAIAALRSKLWRRPSSILGWNSGFLGTVTSETTGQILQLGPLWMGRAEGRLAASFRYNFTRHYSKRRRSSWQTHQQIYNPKKIPLKLKVRAEVKVVPVLN
jgi:hypothetical protein